MFALASAFGPECWGKKGIQSNMHVKDGIVRGQKKVKLCKFTEDYINIYGTK